MADIVETPEGEYKRGIEDYRKEQSVVKRGFSPPKDSQNSDRKMHSPQRERKRSRSRSPIRRRSRSPYDRRSSRGGASQTKGKEYRVYVSNMSYNVKWMNLKDVMKKVGPVDHVEVFTDGDGRSKGCGVVEFARKEDADQAIKEYNGYDLMGRNIRLREDAMDNNIYNEQLKTQKEKTKALKEHQHIHDMQSSNPLASGLGALGGLGGLGGLGALGALGGLGGIGLLGNQASGLITLLNSKGGDPANSAVFISNLDYTVTWQDLKDMLRKAGNCRNCNVAIDESSKKSKGYGSAQFDTPMEALTAIALYNGREMGRDRRQIIVRLDRQAQLNQVLGQMGITEITQSTLIQLQSLALLSTMGGIGGLSGLGALGGLNNSAIGGATSNLGGGYQAQSNLGTNSAALGGLSNIAGLGSLGGLGNLLNTAAGGTVGGLAGNSLASLTGGAGGGGANLPSNFGVGGSFGGNTGTNYVAGQQLSNYSITGTNSGAKTSGYSSTDNRGRNSDGRTRYGMSSDSSSTGGATAKTRVFVRNLPFSVKWQDLKDKFRDAGRILRADIKTDDQNRSKGCGTVTFETNEEALKSVSLFNGFRIEGREIEVRMDRAVGER